MKDHPDVASTIPRRDWLWDSDTRGVHTFEPKLVWFSQFTSGGPSSDAASEQSYRDFLARGAPCEVPPEIEQELRSLVAERWTEPRLMNAFEGWGKMDNAAVLFVQAAVLGQPAPTPVFIAQVSKGQLGSRREGPIEWFTYRAELFESNGWVAVVEQSREVIDSAGKTVEPTTLIRRVFISKDSGASWQAAPEDLEVTGLELADETASFEG